MRIRVSNLCSFATHNSSSTSIFHKRKSRRRRTKNKEKTGVLFIGSCCLLWLLLSPFLREKSRRTRRKRTRWATAHLWWDDNTYIHTFRFSKSRSLSLIESSRFLEILYNYLMFSDHFFKLFHEIWVLFCSELLIEKLVFLIVQVQILEFSVLGLATIGSNCQISLYSPSFPPISSHFSAKNSSLGPLFPTSSCPIFIFSIPSTSSNCPCTPHKFVSSSLLFFSILSDVYSSEFHSISSVAAHTRTRVRRATTSETVWRVERRRRCEE